MQLELFYLTLVTILTSVMWVPYVINRIIKNGLTSSVGYSDTPFIQSAWAHRLKKAHANAIENLVIFAILILILQISNISNNITIMAAFIYFWARLIHVIMYTLAVPWVRTLAFTVGFLAQLTLAWELLNASL